MGSCGTNAVEQRQGADDHAEAERATADDAQRPARTARAPVTQGGGDADADGERLPRDHLPARPRRRSTVAAASTGATAERRWSAAGRRWRENAHHSALTRTTATRRRSRRLMAAASSPSADPTSGRDPYLGREPSSRRSRTGADADVCSRRGIDVRARRPLRRTPPGALAARRGARRARRPPRPGHRDRRSGRHRQDAAARRARRPRRRPRAHRPGRRGRRPRTRSAVLGLRRRAGRVPRRASSRRRLANLDEDVRVELAQVFPSLSDLGRGGSPGVLHERYRTNRAVRELLERLAATKPLVLILDDFHWADPASVDLAASLLHRPPAAGVLIVLASRPNHASPRLHSATGQRAASRPADAHRARPADRRGGRRHARPRALRRRQPRCCTRSRAATRSTWSSWRARPTARRGSRSGRSRRSPSCGCRRWSWPR